MYKDAGDGRDAKILEKSEKARKEFWDKCDKIKKSHGYSDKLIQETANLAALEYNKIFGRIGVHPLLHLKGGKKRPRYLVDRDETWVIYKPPMWQMGGSHEAWRKNVQYVSSARKTLEGQEDQYLSSEKAEVVQEWHALQTGLLWVPTEHAHGDMKGWGFIQRLDLETDGPVIIAKTWRSMRCLQVQMKEHVNTKAYMCLVHGKLENRPQYIRRRFSELGSEATTQVMLQHDQVNDPFYDWSTSGRWQNRSVRMAETFFKPMAYYHRKEDNTDYTLVYVNILTGITHQIRITMQSCGHPLVSDDRYLPKEQAMADLKWCPRNFLVEVRSDFFDLTGPYEDEQKKRYARISIENPLPKVFQNVLTSKLQLTEQLDETGDNFVGPQYWAIGDQELMNAFPKDEEYRREVVQWGTERGIQDDALDRLLLLSKDDVDEVMGNYRPPSELGESKDGYWVCPKCMHWNTPEGAARFDTDPDLCAGGSKIGALGKKCDGTRKVPPDFKTPEGWINYARDPTIHLLYIVNHKWLEARRAILKHSRPSWEKPPHEEDGMEADDGVLAILTAALEQKAKQGEVGIHEQDLPKYPGLEHVKLPLGGLKPESLVQRVRLPGKGTASRWLYTLKASKRIEWTAEFDKRPKRLAGPLFVKSDPLPPKQIKDEEEMEEAPPEDGKDEKKPPQEGAGGGSGDAGAQEPPAKRAKTTPAGQRNWEKKESKSNPGMFYYIDMATGETTVDRPPDFEQPKGKGEPAWEKMLSKSSGKFYYYNRVTGESTVEKPAGVEIKDMTNGVAEKNSRNGHEVREPANNENEVRWERRESTSKPGHYYYFNTRTGANEVTPPRVELPWTLVESKTKRGQYFYYNEITGITAVDPPACAKSAVKANGAANGNGSRTPPRSQINGIKERLPANWVRKESEKYKGKYYYNNLKTGETSWTKPSPWERVESKSHPGQYYYRHCETGETSWSKQIVGAMP